ncbi:hypothetical protein AB0K14_23710 [Actinosynnema sp. NPDC050801]|uniref:hypothetical protein n=1 Tax=unclassified Actinosynnema TaxID=2637065 RepID=UPI0034013B32
MKSFRTSFGVLVTLTLAMLGPTSPQAWGAEQETPRLSCYQKVKMINSGLFELKLEGRIELPQGGVVSTPASAKFANGQERTIDLVMYAADGFKVWPRVQAIAGEKAAGASFRFCKNGEIAVYKATGTLWDVNVTKEN